MHKNKSQTYSKQSFGGPEQVLEYLGRYYAKQNIMQSKNRSTAAHTGYDYNYFA